LVPHSLHDKFGGEFEGLTLSPNAWEKGVTRVTMEATESLLTICDLYTSERCFVFEQIPTESSHNSCNTVEIKIPQAGMKRLSLAVEFNDTTVYPPF